MLGRFGFFIWLSLAADLAQAQAEPQEIGRFSARDIDFIQYQVPQASGPAVDYYISKTKQPAPLVLLIQGSGCTAAFTGLGTPNRSANVFGYLDLAFQGKYAVMVVNKPFVPKDKPSRDGVATACPGQFNDYFTLENWVRDLDLAFDHAQHLPWVTPGKALAIGISEGATAAAALAAQDSRLSGVALMSGSGIGQFYDFVVNAYKSASTDDEARQKLDELEAIRKRIFATPDSASDFAWGHPYKRWSSFFRASPTASLLKSQSRVYIVSGMQDNSVPILSTETMASELVAAGRDVTMRRIPNAGHDLLPPGGQPPQLWPEYQRIIDWFEQVKSQP
jgi:pimeloyl-ACP methyl ester carboxylesterase